MVGFGHGGAGCKPVWKDLIEDGMMDPFWSLYGRHGCSCMFSIRKIQQTGRLWKFNLLTIIIVV
jgi:hypothetical protein